MRRTLSMVQSTNKVESFLEDLSDVYRATLKVIRKYQSLEGQNVANLNRYLTDTLRPELDVLGYADSNEAYADLMISEN